jgi:hypothetical protein
MKWIDEMFVSMEKDRAAESTQNGARGAKVDHTGHPPKKIRGAADVWSALVSSITNDVNDFNKHQMRAGQTAVCISERPSQCEVYLPGMHSKRLVLTLSNNDLQVAVHPEFPKQKLTITIEPEKDGQHAFWVLGDPAKEGAKLSVEQLSEYLLKPVLASAAINQET